GGKRPHTDRLIASRPRFAGLCSLVPLVPRGALAWRIQWQRGSESFLRVPDLAQPAIRNGQDLEKPFYATVVPKTEGAGCAAESRWRKERFPCECRGTTGTNNAGDHGNEIVAVERHLCRRRT